MGLDLPFLGFSTERKWSRSLILYLVPSTKMWTGQVSLSALSILFIAVVFIGRLVIL